MANPKNNFNKKRQGKKRKFRKEVGASPGSLVFTGRQKLEEARLSFTRYNENEFNKAVLDLSKFPMPEKERVTWYDIRGLHDISVIETIGQKFDIHPLILESILDTHQRPKYEEYDDGIFFILKAISFHKETLQIKTEQIALYLFKDALISFQEDESDTCQPVHLRIQNSRGKIRRRGADYLAYALMDTIVDNYYLVLDDIEEVIDEMEDEIIENPDENTKSRIHVLKREMLVLRRAITPLREAISKYSKTEHDLVQESSEIFIRDLYDHLIQVMDSVETYRDTLSGLQDLYISEISFKMNNVMQVLTIISTIFIPLSFLAGLYGMNFKYIPELDWQNGYFYLLGFMLTVAISLLIYFKRKGWM